MNTKVLVLGAALTAFTLTSSAQSGGATQLRSQPASQPKAADVTVTTLAYVDSTQPISPRVQANQSKVIKGVSSNQSAALNCRKSMIASPRAVAECASHVNMPGCTTVAAMK